MKKFAIFLIIILFLPVLVFSQTLRDSTKVKKSGDKMSGPLDMDGQDVENVGTLTADIINAFIQISTGNALVFIAVADGQNILKGEAVYVSGATGPNIKIKRADNTSTIIEQANAIGLAYEDINDGNEGLVIVFGLFFDVKTNDWAAGDDLWLWADGALTNVIPSSGTKQHLAHVGRSHATKGTLVVHHSAIMNAIAGVIGQDSTIEMGEGGRITFLDGQGNEIVIVTQSSMTILMEVIGSTGSFSVLRNESGDMTIVSATGKVDFKIDSIFGELRIWDGGSGRLSLTCQDNNSYLSTNVGSWYFESTDSWFFRILDGIVVSTINPNGNNSWLGTGDFTKGVKTSTLYVVGRGDFGGDVHADALYDSGGQVVSGNKTREEIRMAESFSTAGNANNASIILKQFETTYSGVTSTSAVFYIKCPNSAKPNYAFASINWSREWDDGTVYVYVNFKTSSTSEGNVWTELGISTCPFVGDSFEIYEATTSVGSGWCDQRTATFTITGSSILFDGKDITFYLGRNYADNCMQTIFYKSKNSTYGVD